RIKSIRQAVVWSIARHIGAKGRPDGVILRSSVKRILVTRPNHRLGNLLLITPLLQEIEATFPLAKVDLFVKGSLAPQLFSQYPCIDKIITLPSRPFIYLPQYLLGWLRLLMRRYDLVINAAYHSSSGRLSTLLARARFKTYGDVQEEIKVLCTDYRHNAKHPVYSLRAYLGSATGVSRISSPAPLLDLRLTKTELERGRRLLRTVAPVTRPVISLFTYATGEKCLSREWWKELLIL